MSLYGWGCNISHQLPHQMENLLHVYEPAQMSSFKEKALIEVAAGDGHGIILTDSGDVYTFGRGKDGQLGNGDTKCFREPQLVSALQHETVIHVKAGAVSSYAITATGKCYQWGLVHESVSRSLPTEAEDNATSGALMGLAQDKSNTIIHIDEESRAAYGMKSLGNPDLLASNQPNHPSHRHPRTLDEIVKDSTEKWMLTNDDADEEYYRELRAVGYDKEEVEEKLQNRGREYHGMLKMGCLRRIQVFPDMIKLKGVRVTAVAAGYAHTMLLSDAGMLYGCGYNDRGQLGLG